MGPSVSECGWNLTVSDYVQGSVSAMKANVHPLANGTKKGWFCLLPGFQFPLMLSFTHMCPVFIHFMKLAVTGVRLEGEN